MKDNLKPGVRVVVIDDDHKLRRGTVKVHYDMLDVVLVKFDDGNVEKVPFKKIGIEPEAQEDEKKEPEEKTMITITPDEFEKITTKIVGKILFKLRRPELIPIVGTILGDIHYALFFGEDEDEDEDD